MADAVTVTRLWPANLDQPSSVFVYNFTNISDSTGESNVKKVDIATLLNYFGVKPNGLRIEQLRWAIQGMTYVKLGWDRTAGQNTAQVLAASGYEDYRGQVSRAGDGGVQDLTKLGGKADPSQGNADAKGSLMLSTVGAVNGGSYDITVWLRAEPNQTAT